MFSFPQFVDRSTIKVSLDEQQLTGLNRYKCPKA
jgi:hypothetical protein